MDATTLPSTNSLLTSAIKDFPAFRFKEGDEFHWQPAEKTIYFDSGDPLLPARLLHEISHAVLGHAAYSRDIELIAMERDAWEHTKLVLGPQFDVQISSDIIEDSLDTYRVWLHSRSTCPSCEGNGLQRADLAYECPSCRTTWTANQAKVCALRRYTKKRL